MAWNGIGTYVLPPAYSPEVNGTTIDATRYNGLTSDVAVGITQALNKNGENSPSANINFGTWKITNLGAPTVAGDALSWGANAVFSKVGVGAANTELIDVSSTSAARTAIKVRNTTAGVGSSAGFMATNDTGERAILDQTSSAYTAVPLFGLRAGVLYSEGSGGWAIATLGTSIRLGIGGVTETHRFIANGFYVGKAGDLLNQFNGYGTGYIDLVNREAGGGVRIYTNGGGVVAASFASNGDLTMPGSTNAKGVSVTAVKTAALSRNSVIVPADDPDLIVTLQNGWYAVEVFIPLTIAASGGPNGWKITIACTSTLANDSQMLISNDVTIAGMQRGTFINGQLATTANSGSADWILLKGVCQITSPGALVVRWSQNSSGAQNLTFNAGSYITATKLV